MVAHLRINGTLIERDVQKDPVTTKGKSPQVTNTLTATSGHHQATSTGNHHVVTTFKQTSTANKLLKPSSTHSSKAYTSTSTLPDQSNLSSTDGGNGSKTSFQWFGVILIAATIIIIMITMICRKYKSQERKGNIRLKDEVDLPEIPNFESLPPENNDSLTNDMNTNIDSTLIDITDNDNGVISNNNDLLLINIINVTGSGDENDEVIIESNDDNNGDSSGDSNGNSNNYSNGDSNGNSSNGDRNNDRNNEGDGGSVEEDNSNRIPSQPPMVQLNRLSSASLLIDYTSPFEDSYRIDDHDAHNYPSPAVINNSGGDRSSTTLVHELEMEHQGISSMNRMTLSDYNDYSDAIQPDYPSFESLFPNPPERVVSKK